MTHKASSQIFIKTNSLKNSKQNFLPCALDIVLYCSLPKHCRFNKLANLFVLTFI